MLEIAFLQFPTSGNMLAETVKEFCRRRLVGGASITAATLEGALGRTVQDAGGRRARSNAPFDLAAISFNTPGAPRAYREARRLKALGKTVLAGGPHVSARPAEALEYFDAVCLGPGELQFPAMVEDAERGRLRRTYRGEPGAWVVPRRTATRGLSLVQLSRGCSKHCRFCSVPVFFAGGVDEKPLALVARELAESPATLSLVDDDFRPHTERGERVLALLRDTAKRFVCQVSPETARDRDGLRKLARAGCTLVGVGLESVDPGSLAFLGKPPLADPGELVRRIQDAGMACYLNLLFGSDGETQAIFEKTLAFLDAARPAVVSPHLLTPYPETALHHHLVRQNRLLRAAGEFPAAWAFFDTRHVTFIPDPMTPSQLEEGFAAFCKQLFSWRRTIRRAPGKHLGVALLSSILKNAW